MLVALVQSAGDRQLEDAVTEELEALVRRRAVWGPGGVREDVVEPLGRQRVDQPAKLTAGRRAATGAQ
jgi:hypothetical protein